MRLSLSISLKSLLYSSLFLFDTFAVDFGILERLLIVAKEKGYAQDDQVKVEDENEHAVPDASNNVTVFPLIH